MPKRIKQLLLLIGIPMTLQKSEEPWDPLDILLKAPWWISAALAALVYVSLAIVLPSLELPDIAWVREYAWYAHQVAPFIALVFLVHAAMSAILFRHHRKQREQTQQEVQALLRVLETEPVVTDSVSATPVDSACPMCGSELARRSLHTDKDAKDGFWECSTYPSAGTGEVPSL